MKKCLAIIYLLISLSSFSQKHQLEAIQFKITCGSGAFTSKEIEEFKILHTLGDVNTIRGKLIDGNDIEKVLSVIMLRHYAQNKIANITPIELKAIDRMKVSKRKFILCFTCTFHEKGTLKYFFKKKLDGLIKISIVDRS
jgi:hypothetical protein